MAKIDLHEFHDARRALIMIYGVNPTEESEKAVKALDQLQKQLVDAFGDEALDFGEPQENMQFCDDQLRTHGHIYCPYCLSSDRFDGYGREDSLKYTYQVLICRSCDRTFAIRHENPTVVTGEQMDKELVQEERMSYLSIPGA